MDTHTKPFEANGYDFIISNDPALQMNGNPADHSFRVYVLPAGKYIGSASSVLSAQGTAIAYAQGD